MNHLFMIFFQLDSVDFLSENLPREKMNRLDVPEDI